MKIKGANAIIKVLQEEGADIIFGYPGGSVTNIFNALYGSAVKNILPVHEQGAVHAADGYARATGKVGVCLATAGPGATNIITGLATAYLDSIPLVAITGQVASQHIGRDSFQEVDIVSMTMAVTKYNTMVTDINDLVPSLRKAFRIAREGRQGPVLVDVPSSIQISEVDWSEIITVAMTTEEPEISKQDNDFEQCIQAIRVAKRPLLLIGGGVISAGVAADIVTIVEKFNMPIASTLMGLGAVPTEHKNFLGLTGMHGHKAANLAVSDADTLIVIGSRVSERVTGDRDVYANQKKIIHFDIDPSEVDKNIVSEISIFGDLKETVPNIASRNLPELSIREWWEQIRSWQQEFAMVVIAEENEKITAPWVMLEMSRLLKSKDPVYVSDVGQNQMWAAQHLKITSPRHHITSGGCGTMGFALPASIGVQIACPEKFVVSISGDGGFKMTGMELYTAVNQKLPLLNIVINNSCLGMVRQWQELFFEERYSSTILEEFDFISFAKSFKAQAILVRTKKEFTAAILKSMKPRTVPLVIEVRIEQNDMVEPMVAPNAPIQKFVDIWR